MRKVEKELDVITGVAAIKNKTIIDVGCGTGGLVRNLTAQGAETIGIDSPDMLAKARDSSPVGQEKYIAGVGENLPLKNNYADIIVFFASFHHVPRPKMMQTLQEAHRVLKTGGIGIFVEPVGQEGSYFEIIRLVEDERDIQKLAFESIKKAHTLGLENKKEDIIYVERSFADYVNLLKVFVDDETERNEYLAEARKITDNISRKAGISFEDYRFKSICRVNMLEKS